MRAMNAKGTELKISLCFSFLAMNTPVAFWNDCENALVKLCSHVGGVCGCFVSLSACLTPGQLLGSWQPGQQQHRRCLWEQLGGGANQLQQIFRPLNSTVAPILGWDPPQVLMGG